MVYYIKKLSHKGQHIYNKPYMVNYKKLSRANYIDTLKGIKKLKKNIY
jgi:hypothetical protein